MEGVVENDAYWNFLPEVVAKIFIIFNYNEQIVFPLSIHYMNINF